MRLTEEGKEGRKEVVVPAKSIHLHCLCLSERRRRKGGGGGGGSERERGGTISFNIHPTSWLLLAFPYEALLFEMASSPLLFFPCQPSSFFSSSEKGRFSWMPLFPSLSHLSCFRSNPPSSSSFRKKIWLLAELDGIKEGPGQKILLPLDLKGANLEDHCCRVLLPSHYHLRTLLSRTLALAPDGTIAHFMEKLHCVSTHYKDMCTRRNFFFSLSLSGLFSPWSRCLKSASLSRGMHILYFFAPPPAGINMGRPSIQKRKKMGGKGGKRRYIKTTLCLG